VITPEQLAAGGSEQSHQKALFCWAALNFNKYPQLKFMYHVPNGGFRNVREASNLKASGVRAGVPDIHLPARRGQYGGLFIELKIGKGKASSEQEIWKNYLNLNGYYATVCHGWQEAVAVIENYLKL
jgi:hypothetical protein